MSVSFGPDDVRAAIGPDAIRANVPRCRVMAVLTSQTCGEPCWHAREEICRCSCGGRNHGCLLIPGGEAPERMAKIDGERYKLAGVGLHRDLIEQAQALNGRQWRGLEKPCAVIGAEGVSNATPEQLAAARASGKDVWFTQYYYRWREVDAGAPARIKTATPDQIARWTELTGWKDRAREGVCLLWERVTMPAAPAELRIGRDGIPLKNQSPNGPQI